MGSNQKPRRMKYNWLLDRPRHVTRQEYDRYQLLFFGAIASGVMAAGLLLMAVTGATTKTSSELADIPEMTVAEAASATTDQELVKISGYLIGEAAPVMPDDPALKVLRGNVKLTVRDESLAEDVTVEATVLEWSDSVDQILLTDNRDNAIPIALDLEQFPLSDVEPEFEARPKVQRANTDEGDRQPSHVEYGGAVFELDPVKWRNAESAFTDLERQLLPYGQAVVIVAGLQDQTLVDPLGDRLRIELGTETEIRQTGQRMRWLFSVLWLPLAGTSYFLVNQALELRREFVMRSNE
ncbi:hypothetical protein [[Limnothrix rosea] IAM M-220]|uniref:hypothetical protein n=1 Tax=[Limnothrix rosea] IAM M-220 TaxID=454133 RepID=UPI00095E6A09|nr:hypothetical protein [[Limnothrix rosea] IAM M-220]OKH19580.1 hypothetical protein NIES208_01905 [[Limnothrix rosea] IAM M-220]